MCDIGSLVLLTNQRIWDSLCCWPINEWDCLFSDTVQSTSIRYCWPFRATTI